mgnify:FL=1
MVLAFTSMWHSGEAPLWAKIAFAVGDLIMLSGFAWITADAARTFRTDWILYKARKEHA